MIEVRNLRKIYGDTVAVDDISFDLAAGRVLGFLGPNGAGKTTTMRMLTGFTPATGGVARIGGYDIAKDSVKVRSMLGYLPESAPIYGEMTVEAYVSFFAEVKGLGGSARRRAVGQALDECGVAHVSHRLLRNLSKGYRQRAAIAQAVVGDPQLVILDEPTVGLDPRQIRDIRGLIARMAERRTVILSTHILPEVSLTCTDVVIIDRGLVRATGTPKNIHSTIPQSNRLQVIARGDQAALRAAISAVAHVKGVSDEDGDDAVAGIHDFSVKLDGKHDVRGDVARAVSGLGADLLELRLVGLSLEDVFIHITSGTAQTGEERKDEK